MQHLQRPPSYVAFSSSTPFLMASWCFSGIPFECCWFWAAFLASTTRRTINANVSSMLTFNFALVSMNPIPCARAHASPSEEEIALWLAKSHLFPAITLTFRTWLGSSSVVVVMRSSKYANCSKVAGDVISYTSRYASAFPKCDDCHNPRYSSWPAVSIPN